MLKKVGELEADLQANLSELKMVILTLRVLYTGGVLYFRLREREREREYCKQSANFAIRRWDDFYHNIDV